jgi:phage tail tape-measure protein
VTKDIAVEKTDRNLSMLSVGTSALVIFLSIISVVNCASTMACSFECVGEQDGIEEGRALELIGVVSVGIALGVAVGGEVGKKLGEILGAVLSDEVGKKLGEVLGALLGDELGEKLGEVFEAIVGGELGMKLGDVLGNPLHLYSGRKHSRLSGDVKERRRMQKSSIISSFWLTG